MSIQSARGGSSISFSDSLRVAAGERWERVVRHRFTTELAAGTIDRAVLTRYLIQDHRFLDAFVVLLASIVAHARTLSDRIPGCQFLAVVTGQENTYFERSFQRLGVSAEDRQQIPDAPCTTNFCNLMRDVAMTGSLAEMLSVIVDFVTYEWVDLHSGPDFEAVVQYLRDLLDKEGDVMSDSQKEACTSRFLQAVQLEEDFFDFAYNSS